MKSDNINEAAAFLADTALDHGAHESEVIKAFERQCERMRDNIRESERNAAEFDQLSLARGSK